MILTGKAAEFAEGFEKLEASLGERLGDQEITEDDQIALFMITKMFMKDSLFRTMITLTLHSFKDMRLSDALKKEDENGV